MKLNGKITILINQDETTIEIMDDKASVTIVKITLTPEQLSSALSRLARTDCELETFNLDKIGKQMEIKTFEYEHPSTLTLLSVFGPNANIDINDENLAKYAKYLLDKDENNVNWIPDKYFKSQNSFFTKDNIKYFRGIARRWV